MNNLALYQIADAYVRDLQLLQEKDIDDPTFLDALDRLEGELQEKATNVAMFIRNMEATAEAIKAAEADMYARRKSIEAKTERIKAYLLENMLRTGIKKIESPWFKIAVRDNPESVIVEPDAQIPQEYYRQPEPPPPVLDKVNLKKDLQLGVIVPGCRLDRKQRIEIK